MIALTVNSTNATAYLCQSSGITTALNTTSHAALSGFNFYIASDPGIFPDRLFNGNISTTMIYNRDLNFNEIVQNFNAHKGRYGL